MPPNKEQKKCDSCGVFFSVLDPHSSCVKCVVRLCSKGKPCAACSSLSPEGWKLWEDLRVKSRANYKKQVRASAKGKDGGGASSTKITRDPPSRPPKLGGNPGASQAKFDALSYKVDSLASGMDMLVKMMLEKEQSSSAKRSNGIPHVFPHEGNVAQTTSVVASEANSVAQSPTRVGDTLDNTVTRPTTRVVGLAEEFSAMLPQTATRVAINESLRPIWANKDNVVPMEQEGSFLAGTVVPAGVGVSKRADSVSPQLLVEHGRCPMAQAFLGSPRMLTSPPGFPVMPARMAGFQVHEDHVPANLVRDSPGSFDPGHFVPVHMSRDRPGSLDPGHLVPGQVSRDI